MRLGKISPSSTQTIGPQVAPKKITKRLAPTRASGPQAPGSCGVPPSVTTACEKARAMSPSDTTMPADPVSSSGRRPILSTKKIATKVTATLMTLVTTEMVNDVPLLVVSKPTELQRLVE